MLGLYAAGLLSRCPTLPHTLDVERVRALPFATAGQQTYRQQLLEALRGSAEADALRAALDQGAGALAAQPPAAE
jgi:hypothetical protein